MRGSRVGSVHTRKFARESDSCALLRPNDPSWRVLFPKWKSPNGARSEVAKVIASRPDKGQHIYNS